MAKSMIREIDSNIILHRDIATGIAWIENGTTGCVHSCHANIDSTGSVKGMKNLGYWKQNDRTVRIRGFIYNIDTFVFDIEDKYDLIVANECCCQGCIERREN